MKILKYIFLFLFTIVLTIPTSITAQDKLYDVVIVGGGLTGLSASYYLQDKDVLVLEAKNVLGGEFTLPQTKPNFKHHFKLHNKTEISLPVTLDIKNFIRSSGPVGLCYNGKIYYGAEIIDSFKKLNLSQRIREEINLLEFSEDKNLKNISPLAYKILNPFFQVFHPFHDINNFNPEYAQSYLFKKAYCLLIKNGANTIINKYLNKMKAKYELNASIISILDLGNRVEITYKQKNKVKKVYAKTALLTISPSEVLKTTPLIHSSCRKLLNNISEKKLIILSLAVKSSKIKDFSYICTPDLDMSFIYKFNLTDNQELIELYFFQDKANVSWNLSDKQLIDQAIDDLKYFNIADIKQNNIVYSHTKKQVLWVHNNPSFYKAGKANLTASKRIFITGEYTGSLNKISRSSFLLTQQVVELIRKNLK